MCHMNSLPGRGPKLLFFVCLLFARTWSGVHGKKTKNNITCSTPYETIICSPIANYVDTHGYNACYIPFIAWVCNPLDVEYIYMKEIPS